VCLLLWIIDVLWPKGVFDHSVVLFQIWDDGFKLCLKGYLCLHRPICSRHLQTSQICTNLWTVVWKKQIESCYNRGFCQLMHTILNLQVRLKVKPLKEGVLKVVGVNWILSGVAAGHRDFAVLGPRIKRSKSGARDEPPPHQRLKFHVLRVCSAALTFFWLQCFSGLLQKMFFLCSGPINGLYTVVRSCRRDYLGHRTLVWSLTGPTARCDAEFCSLSTTVICFTLLYNCIAQLTVGSLYTCNHWGLLLMWCCSTCQDWTCLYMSCQQESTLGSCTGLCWSFIILQKFLWRWIEYFSHCSPLSFQDFRKILLSWEKNCFPCGETPCSIQQWWSEHVGLGYFRKYIAWVSFYVSAITVGDWSLWHCFFMWSNWETLSVLNSYVAMNKQMADWITLFHSRWQVAAHLTLNVCFGRNWNWSQTIRTLC